VRRGVGSVRRLCKAGVRWGGIQKFTPAGGVMFKGTPGGCLWGLQKGLCVCVGRGGYTGGEWSVCGFSSEDVRSLLIVSDEDDLAEIVHTCTLFAKCRRLASFFLLICFYIITSKNA